MDKEIYWSRFADDFQERNSYVIGNADMQLMFNKLSELKNLKHTIELGCGNGIYTKIISKNADKYIASDFSDEMINAAKINLKNFKNVEVKKANCFDLEYTASSFDTVFMANLLHIIPEPEKAIDQAKKILKKHGTLIIISYTTEGMKFNNRVGMMFRYLKTYGSPPIKAKKIHLKQTEKLLVKNGFTISESELIGKKTKAIFIKAIK